MPLSWRFALILLISIVYLHIAQSIWFPWYFRRYGLEPHSSRHSESWKTPLTPGSGKPTSSGKSAVTCPPGYELKGKGSPYAESRVCDDNPVVLQLARLYVVSPERIVLLLAQPKLMESCEEIADVLKHIDTTTNMCVLAGDNIYAKLTNGLKYFKAEVCDGVSESTGNKKRCAGLTEAHSCIKELRMDMIECEAPADWYERRNATKVCQSFNNVLDCYYIRGAMLCGLVAAKQLRSFAGDIMKRAIIHSCEVNKQLPRVSDPMPILSSAISYGTSIRSVFFYLQIAVRLLFVL